MLCDITVSGKFNMAALMAELPISHFFRHNTKTISTAIYIFIYAGEVPLFNGTIKNVL